MIRVSDVVKFARSVRRRESHASAARSLCRIRKSNTNCGSPTPANAASTLSASGVHGGRPGGFAAGLVPWIVFLAEITRKLARCAKHAICDHPGQRDESGHALPAGR